MQFTLKWKKHVLNLDHRTHIMGVINVTPDSFSDGGKYLQRDKAIEHGLRMAGDGADIIDVGGESTRPYSKKISLEEELDRVIPVIKGLSEKIDIPISIDTYKSEVASEALRAGASVINDISALKFDPRMISIAADAGVPVILMHMKGTPKDMQDNPLYENLVHDIITFLKKAIERAVKGGISEELIIVDPGIGFGKSFDHNLEILKELNRFQSIGRPLLLGTSRKAFIGHILDKHTHERDNGTMATIAAGIMNGAQMVRVHNVKMTREVVKIVDAVKRGKVSE